MKESQTSNILNFLLLGVKLNGLDALRYFKCFRLASRIWSIEKDFGIRAERRMIKTESGKHICEYWFPRNKLSV